MTFIKGILLAIALGAAVILVWFIGIVGLLFVVPVVGSIAAYTGLFGTAKSISRTKRLAVATAIATIVAVFLIYGYQEAKRQEVVAREQQAKVVEATRRAQDEAKRNSLTPAATTATTATSNSVAAIRPVTLPTVIRVPLLGEGIQSNVIVNIDDYRGWRHIDFDCAPAPECRNTVIIHIEDGTPIPLSTKKEVNIRGKIRFSGPRDQEGIVRATPP